MARRKFPTRRQNFSLGFSRGADQVRALAGMITTMGLMYPGNDRLIPFAYELYAKRHKGKATKDAIQICKHFKQEFSREDPGVRVHFVGVWDTVSSISIFRGPPTRRTDDTTENIPAGVKEVWFAGTHSDIGGGNRENMRLDLAGVPLLWMENEATTAGLHLRRRDKVQWNWDELRTEGPRNL
ncbi:hypothetical protein K438DRAFT_577124 [Mycena galopus ATCC 62051]|nr:hypothetical protein K438DRAFT_577124 [Mycena galopus ATCC 62051]